MLHSPMVLVVAVAWPCWVEEEEKVEVVEVVVVVVVVIVVGCACVCVNVWVGGVLGGFYDTPRLILMLRPPGVLDAAAATVGLPGSGVRRRARGARHPHRRRPDHTDAGGSRADELELGCLLAR